VCSGREGARPSAFVSDLRLMHLLLAGILVAAVAAAGGQVAAVPPPPSELLGIWRGTSTCTDRTAAPACTDEIAVYEFSAGAKPGTVHWQADKMVNGRREAMGASELTYDATNACWKAEIAGPRASSVWCLSVHGTHLTGTATLLPGKHTIRKIDLTRSPDGPPHRDSSGAAR
jgi:hypothetical protein